MTRVEIGANERRSAYQYTVIVVWKCKGSKNACLMYHCTHPFVRSGNMYTTIIRRIQLLGNHSVDTSSGVSQGIVHPAISASAW